MHNKLTTLAIDAKRSLKTYDKLDEVQKSIGKSEHILDIIKNSQSSYVGDGLVLTSLFTGQKIYAIGKDTSVAPSLILDGKWEMPITKLVRQLLGPGENFFDVGANHGYFGIISSLEVGPTGSVHYFEALPHLASVIKMSVHTNSYQGISSINTMAVSDADDKEIEIATPDDFMGSSSAVGAWTQYDIKKTVAKTITLDNYCRKTKVIPDLVKIDVEGYEPYVLAGFYKTLKKNKKIKLLIEFTPGMYEDPKKFFEDVSSHFSHVYFISEMEDEYEKKRIHTYFHLKEKIPGHGYVMVLFANE